jgi:hypothetical protein
MQLINCKVVFIPTTKTHILLYVYLNSVLCITSSKLKSLHVTLHTCLLLSQDRIRRQETPGGKCLVAALLR